MARTTEIFIQDPWFTEVAEGRKTVEGRTGPKDKFRIDDFLRVKGPAHSGNERGSRSSIEVPDCKVLHMYVEETRHYDNLDDYLKHEELNKFAPHLSSLSEAEAAYLNITMEVGDQENKKIIDVFSYERVKERGGIIALQLSFASR